jgi:hypothetical protein
MPAWAVVLLACGAAAAGALVTYVLFCACMARGLRG